MNTTPEYVLLGFITCNVKGRGAVHKIAKKRIDFIEVNIESFSRVLNNLKKGEFNRKKKSDFVVLMVA